MTNLTELDLSHSNIDNLPYLPNLMKLDLNHNISNEGIKNLFGLTNLNDNRTIDDEGLANLISLTYLDLTMNMVISDDGIIN